MLYSNNETTFFFQLLRVR